MLGKVCLISEWRDGLKFLSILCNVVGVFIVGVIAILKANHVHVPDDLIWIMAIATPVASSIGRLIKQFPATEKAPED